MFKSAISILTVATFLLSSTVISANEIYWEQKSYPISDLFGWKSGDKRAYYKDHVLECITMEDYVLAKVGGTEVFKIPIIKSVDSSMKMCKRKTKNIVDKLSTNEEFR